MPVALRMTFRFGYLGLGFCALGYIGVGKDNFENDFNSQSKSHMRKLF